MVESYRIAVADDDPVVIQFLRDCLTRAGHFVVAEAHSGRTLVALCKDSPPDLIITDIKMDDLDGLSAVEAIHEYHPLPVVLVSAYVNEEFIARAIRCRVLAYLLKPIREEELLAAVPLATQRFRELEALRTEAASTRQALEDRKVIERAKGIIIRKLDLDEAAAFQYLQKLARDSRQQLSVVAKGIVFTESAFSSSTRS